MENGEDVVQSAAGSGSISPSQYVRVSLQTRCVNISRPVYDQASFDRQFQADVVDAPPLGDRLRSLLPAGCSRSTPGEVCRRVSRYLPVIEHLRNYRWGSWLLRDVIAGLSSGVIHVPQVASL